MDEVTQLEHDITKLQIEIKGRQDRLEYIRRNCQHTWSETVFEPIHTPGYHIPGDKPSTLGMDHRGAMDVPAKTTRQWRRSCTSCKMSQTTQRTKKMQVNGTIPGTMAEAEIPDFS